ncbi:MAG TPA: thioredoxin [Nitrospirae bacterium]|nr:thioredoxin [Nitrospirota bacterium]
MAEGVVEFTTNNWENEVIKSKGLIMVDFWAAWCGPCKMLAPTIEELAKEYAGKVQVGKLNTDENSEIASRYKIMGIPTVIFFKDGKEIDKVVGAVPKSQLKNKLDTYLG